MNENYIKEYEEMSLCDFADELVEPLCIIKKDLTKAIYIRYAEERDKNDELEKENTRLKEVIKEVREYIEKYRYITDKVTDEDSLYYGQYITMYAFNDDNVMELLQILDKVKD